MSALSQQRNMNIFSPVDVHSTTNVEMSINEVADSINAGGMRDSIHIAKSPFHLVTLLCAARVVRCSTRSPGLITPLLGSEPIIPFFMAGVNAEGERGIYGNLQ